TLHPAALLFTLGLSVLTTILFGFLPAWRLSHVAPQAFLKDGVQTGSSRSSQRLQNAVAIGEIALALVLLVGGSLLVRICFRVLNARLGSVLLVVVPARCILHASRLFGLKPPPAVP